MSKQIAICAGHYKERHGATNKKHGINEHDEATKVVACLFDILVSFGYDVSIFSGRLSDKIRSINSGNFKLALDVHFNAGGGHGCEVVHVPDSIHRTMQATDFSHEISASMGIKDRGAKNGWWFGKLRDGKPYIKDAFVSETNCPAFIPEPLFIDNDEEVEKWLIIGRHREIAQPIANWVKSYLN